MAIFHFVLRKITRSRGSATNAIAYITGSKLDDSYDGICFDYRAKKYVDETMIILPENAPKEWNDLQTLTDAINASSNQSDAILCREIEIALPFELTSEEQKDLAIKYLKETFVDDGMAVVVAFHYPKKDPRDEYSYNPHLHAIITAKPFDDEGNWISKSTRLYVCENEVGDTKLLTPDELKLTDDYEKLYHYRTAEGSDLWKTKAYANEHKDECVQLVNRYPKCTKLRHPLAEKWSNPKTLDEWREQWAIAQNEKFELLGLPIRVSHLSYLRQGSDLIPTIHEGKKVTALERKIESAVIDSFEHTSIRSLNEAIRDHNRTIVMVNELKMLRSQMERLLLPVIERVQNVETSLLEMIEQLRAEIIALSIRIKKAIQVESEVDEKIISNQEYLKDLAPFTDERLRELNAELRQIRSSYKGSNREYRERQIEQEISVFEENKRYSIDAKEQLHSLVASSNDLKWKVGGLKEDLNSKIEELRKMSSQVDTSSYPNFYENQREIRAKIENNYYKEFGEMEFSVESKRIDEKLCENFIKGEGLSFKGLT